jgi:hypothetical protein
MIWKYKVRKLHNTFLQEEILCSFGSYINKLYASVKNSTTDNCRINLQLTYIKI